MKERKRLLIQLLLFVVTVITTTLAGSELIVNKSLIFGEERMTWAEVLRGLEYSIPFLLILSFHEFGHYFTARYHKIKTTLPYYIPLWIPITLSFGTMGALIRIQEAIRSRKHFFDVGISGPIAGFVVAMGFIWYGFTHLPEPEYIFQVHPEYEQYGLDYPKYVYKEDQNPFMLGNNLTFWFFETYVAEPDRMPNPNEIIHYPYLIVGFLSLFFTALNLLPIGQLDGGHIIFGLFGMRNHRNISRVLFVSLVFYSGLGIIGIDDLKGINGDQLLDFALSMGIYLYFLYICSYSLMEKRMDRWLFAAIMMTSQVAIHYVTGWVGYSGWMVFALILGRFIGIYHPRVVENKELSIGRKILGVIALIIFILSFSPKPFIADF